MRKKRNFVEPTSFLKGSFSAKSSESTVIVEGFANKSVVDRGNDIIPPSAWENGLDNFKKNPVILFNHQPDLPIGTAQDIRATKDGLFLRAKISDSDDPFTTRIRNLVKDKTLRAFSVGFESKDENKNNDGVNEIKSAELFEVSVVGIPMNQDSIFEVVQKGSKRKKMSMIEAMKALDELEKQEDSDEEEETSEEEEETKTPTKTEEEKQQEPMILQSLVFSKSIFATKDEAVQWAKDHDYKTDKVDETEASYRLRQRSPDDFMEASFRTIQLAKGIQAIMGEVKSVEPNEAKQADQEDGDDAPTVPIKTERNEEDFGNPHLEATKQTNVLLGQLISEMQQLRKQILQLNVAAATNEEESNEEEEDKGSGFEDENEEEEDKNNELSHNLLQTRQRDKLNEEQKLAESEFKEVTQKYLASFRKRLERLGV